MKKIFLLFLILPFSLTVLISQNLLIGTENWRLNDQGVPELDDKLVFDYDERGNQTSTYKTTWNQQTKSFSPAYEITQDFNENDLISNYLYNALSGSNSSTTIDYQYENACLVSTTSNRINDVSHARTITFYNPENCLIDSIESYYQYGSGAASLNKISAHKYFYNENTETRINYCQDSSGNFTIECSQTVFTKNDQGQIIKILGDSDIGPELYIKDYDDQGNLTFESYETQNGSGGWNLEREKSITYTFNQENQILESITSTTNFSNGLPFFVSSLIETYEYYCDGLLKKKTAVSSFGSTSIDIYEYQKGHDCDLSKDEDLLTVRPNFTQGYVLIESELLQAENTEISIYDMSGRTIQHFKTGRIQTYHIDLSNLAAGNYLIHVFNKKHSETERVVKM